MNIIKKLFKRARDIIPPILLLVITFFVYMPCALFLGNVDEFAVGFSKAAQMVVIVSLLAFLVLLIVGLSLVWDKAEKVYIMFVFGIGLGFYIQGNFLNPNFGSLNGQDIIWEYYIKESVVSVFVWGLCIIVPQILLQLKKSTMMSISKWGSYLLCAMQIVALVIAIITTKKTVVSDYGFVKKDMFKLSSNENTIVFVVDTLDTEYYDDIIGNDDEYVSHMRDFTYYTNCISGAAPTVLAMPLMLTGQEYDDLSKGVSDFYSGIYESNTLFKDLKANGYRTSIFTEYDTVNGLKSQEIDNLVKVHEYVIKSPKGFAGALYKLTAFYSMPTPLKRYFWFYSGDFAQYMTLKDSEYETYKCDDHQFKVDYKEQGITTDSSGNAFVMYHLRGSHPPYILDENLDTVPEGSGTRVDQTRGIFNMIFEFIDEMKEKGIYDSSTIIITADHGETQLYQTPAVFVKKKNEHKEYTTNSAPVTFANLRATFASECMDDYSSYGENLDDVPENAIKDRYHTTHEVHKKTVTDKDAIGSTFCRFRFTGHTKDMDKCSVVSTSNNPKKDDGK